MIPLLTDGVPDSGTVSIVISGVNLAFLGVLIFRAGKLTSEVDRLKADVESLCGKMDMTRETLARLEATINGRKGT